MIEQGHYNNAGTIEVDPNATKLATVSFKTSGVVPRAGEKITAISGKAWQSAALAQNASQKVQFGFMIPDQNNTFRFNMLFAVMDGGVGETSEKICKGDFWISGENAAKRIEKLKGCQKIIGSVYIGKTNLKNLDALNGLTEISGHLAIVLNYNLENIEGLNHLKTVNGLSIYKHDKLENIEGLRNLTTVDGSLEIWRNYNKEFINLKGLRNVVSVSGRLLVTINPNLVNLEGFEKLTMANKGIVIANNHSMISLKGIENIRSVGGRTEIYNNPKFDCSPYNKNPLVFFPLRESTGNKVNCTTK